MLLKYTSNTLYSYVYDNKFISYFSLRQITNLGLLYCKNSEPKESLRTIKLDSKRSFI